MTDLSSSVNPVYENEFPGGGVRGGGGEEAGEEEKEEGEKRQGGRTRGQREMKRERNETQNLWRGGEGAVWKMVKKREWRENRRKEERRRKERGSKKKE